MLCWRDSRHPQGGGSERYLERVAEYLVESGHQVTFRTAASPGNPARSEHAGVQFQRRGGRFTVYIAAAVDMMLGKYRDVDVVVDTQNGIPFFATWFQPRPTVLLTHHCHREQWPVAGPVLSRLGWWLESVVAPWAYRKARYVTVSEPSVGELVQLGVDRERIDIVRNGLDPVPHFEPLPPDGRTHLVTLSRLVPHKQIEHALDVIAALAPQHDVVLDVIGSGWWAQQLADYARDIGVHDRVIFHGHLSEAAKHAVLSRASIHLMPSRKEGWGLAVMEAGQHAVPTIGYRQSAGLKDSVVDGHTGILVADKAELIKVAFELLGDPQRARDLGQAAKLRTREFSWEQTGRSFLRVLEQVAAQSPRRD